MGRDWVAAGNLGTGWDWTGPGFSGLGLAWAAAKNPCDWVRLDWIWFLWTGSGLGGRKKISGLGKTGLGLGEAGLGLVFADWVWPG